MELNQNIPNFFKMIQQRQQNGQILRYSNACNVQIVMNDESDVTNYIEQRRVLIRFSSILCLSCLLLFVPLPTFN